MHKLLMTLSAILVGHISFAQNNFPATGDAVISSGNAIRVQSGNNTGVKLFGTGSSWDAGSGPGFLQLYGSFIYDNGANLHFANGASVLNIHSGAPETPVNIQLNGSGNSFFTGNVGIGTQAPQGKLHIESPLDNSVSALTIGNGHHTGNINVPFGASTGGYNIDFKTWRDVVPDQVGARIRAERINNFQPNNALIQGLDLTFHTSDGVEQVNLAERMRIKYNGNVGIGTTNPDARLTVNGTIHSKEVKIDLSVPAPDYVFDHAYQLETLAKTEAYIKANRHLPEIPSAKAMQQDGINLSEMNMLLLKKVEELTLHLIEKDKQLSQLNERISKLETKSLRQK